MPTVVYRGTPEELLTRLLQLAPTLAGKVPDDTGVVEGLLLRLGTTLLGKVTEAYVTKSAGGTDDMGITWPPLSPVTLAMRTKDSSAKVVDRLKRDFAKLPRTRKRLVLTQYKRLKGLYLGGRAADAAALNYARRLLDLTGAYMSPTRFKKLYSELHGRMTKTRAQRLALAGAYSLILRDTGRLLASLSPQIATPDRVLTVAPGAVSVGSNVSYLKYHQSKKPRRLKKDGTPKLPRRQVLPDDTHPVPAAWWADLKAALASGLASPEFWLRFLGEKAATA